MPGRSHHVIPHEDGWAVKGSGDQRASSVHPTQKEAIARGREVSRNQGNRTKNTWSRWENQGQ